jgi:hypothetical protein
MRLSRLMPVVAGFSLRRRYLWSVLIGEAEDEPRGRFVTDPLGVREVFRLRDVPPGKQRRAALLHWVGRIGASGSSLQRWQSDRRRSRGSQRL